MSSQREKVQEQLFRRQSASCAELWVSLQSAAVMEWWMLWRTDRLLFPTSAPCWHAPMARASYSMNSVIPHEQRGRLISGELPVIACHGPTPLVANQPASELCIFRKIWPTPYQYSVVCFNYRKQDWLGISSTLNCRTWRERFSITVCWISLASALQMAKWATAYD